MHRFESKRSRCLGVARVSPRRGRSIFATGPAAGPLCRITRSGEETTKVHHELKLERRTPSMGITADGAFRSQNGSARRHFEAGGRSGIRIGPFLLKTTIGILLWTYTPSLTHWNVGCLESTSVGNFFA